MKTIFVNSCQKTLHRCDLWGIRLINSMNAKRVPEGYTYLMSSKERKYFFIKTANLEIFIFPSGANITNYRGVADEAFYFPAHVARYLYGNRYSQRYGGWLIDYIVEVEGGLGRPEKDGKEFIHEYDL